MKKKHLWGYYLYFPPLPQKFLRVMKLSVLLTCILSVNMMASVYSQNARFNLDVKDQSVRDVLKTIEKESDFRFFYNDEFTDLDKKLTFALTDKSIDDLMAIVLDNTEVSYKVLDNNFIVITPKSIVQQHKVTGVVRDAKTGEPLAGVTIVVVGTSVGYFSDASGKFAIDVPDKNALLNFSYVGYVDQKIPVTDRAVIDVNMEVEVQALNDVVVIGYGTAKRSDLTGSVGSVSSKSYSNQPVTTITSALQGRSAGVAISNVSGAPGGDIHILIRGANSITGGNDPLFVVDGMQLGSFNLNDLNPDDVETIEILKDASATAIYGSRGANGVVMVTTKKGHTEKTKIDFVSNFGIGHRAYKYHYLDPVSYANEINTLSPGAYSDSYITGLRNGKGTDWQDAVFQTSTSQDYQLSLSGTSPKSSYYLSGRYLDQKGIVINSSYKRYSFHSNIESKLNSKMNLSLSAFLNRGVGFNNQTTGSLHGGVEQAIVWSPSEPIYNDDGTVHGGDPWGGLGKNPVANLNGAHQDNIANSALLNAKFTYNIFDFLSLDILAGMDANLSESDNVTGPWADYSTASTEGSSRQHNTAFSYQNSNILTFHKLFGGIHFLTITAAEEASRSNYNYTFAGGTGNPFNNQMGIYGLGLLTGKTMNSGYGASTLNSYIGRINYSLKDKYLITASYRADGSSNFPQNRWGYFPSFGLGWKASEEGFIKDMNIFSNLKIRGGWGVTGNQGVSPFQTIPSMSFGGFGYGTETGSYGTINNITGDPSLKWEQTAQTDVGLDVSFFKNRLNLTADYFNKQTKNLLLTVPNPDFGGGGSNLANVGSSENKGFEFVLSGVPVDMNDFTWNSSFNFSSYKNKVLNLGNKVTYLPSTITNLVGSGDVQDDFERDIVGQSMGTFFGNVFEGIWQTSEAADAALYGAKPGDYKYLDLNKDHVIDGSDRVIIGHSLPKYSWSWDNTFKYKNFELNVFINAVNGNSIFNMDYALASSIYADSKSIKNADVTPWTPENHNNLWPALLSSTNKVIFSSSKWLQDGSFVRVRNVSLSYRFPETLIKGAPLKISISAQNLLTVTKFKGYDPEAAWGDKNGYNQGIVSGAYPSARVYTFSLQLNFQ
jgi:TonB-dependent starch-binding outer membrane protein SusC